MRRTAPLPDVQRHFKRRDVLRLGGAAGVAAALGPAAWAQDAYPTRPIRIVVTFPAGGGPDIAARVIGAKMAANIGQGVIIENRAGATGIIGAEHVARSAPDGYTVVVATPAPLTIATGSGRKLNYTLADFAAVTQGVLQTPLLVVAPDGPYKTVADIIAAAKARPGALTFGSAGIGNSQHLAGELFNQMAGIQTLHVPFPGTAQGLLAVMNRQIDFYFSDPSAMPHVKGGKLRAAAVSTLKRSPNLPDVPTVAEAGVPGYEYSNWYGFCVPAKTPPAVIAYLNREIAKAMADPSVKETLTGAGMDPSPSTPDELAAYMKRDQEKWAKVIRTANIKFE
ncbi:Bug family tripartite tricarboxylate transporter substrate binding protein [Ramlibacter albus]|uniref:Tripartite tricarboxylate transporter substrate binding protein n=1 Tax=Ramlibacter albus TaxID=2079448 RepID=A0A923S3Y3_9BURK|nr:tripartite tricarboxylate transporter substrate binding protein [Ramlibacter albus]MBC5767044.1 tripartite tricarboxylate transporter substrate binding protein [Ramlibacter albus]